MEDILPYAIGVVVIVVFIIVLNHKKQKNTVDNFLKDAQEMQPIFLVKAVEKKLQTLYAVLYENGIKPNASNGVVANGNASASKQLLIRELEQLEKDYSEKKLSLGAYSDKLQVLHLKASKL